MRKVVGFEVNLEAPDDYEQNYFDNRDEAEKYATDKVLRGKWVKVTVNERAEVTVIERKLKIAKAK